MILNHKRVAAAPQPTYRGVYKAVYDIITKLEIGETEEFGPLTYKEAESVRQVAYAHVANSPFRFETTKRLSGGVGNEMYYMYIKRVPKFPYQPNDAGTK